MKDLKNGLKIELNNFLKNLKKKDLEKGDRISKNIINCGWLNLLEIDPSTYIQLYCVDGFYRIDAIDGYDFKVLNLRIW